MESRVHTPYERPLPHRSLAIFDSRQADLVAAARELYIVKKMGDNTSLSVIVTPLTPSITPPSTYKSPHSDCVLVLAVDLPLGVSTFWCWQCE